LIIGGLTCLGIGVGLFTGNVAAGTMIGIGLGLVGEALFHRYGRQSE